MTGNALFDYIIGTNGNDISNDDDSVDKRYQAPSRLEVLRATSVVKLYARSRDLLSNSFHSELLTLQLCIREDKIKSLKQLSLNEVLK